MKLKINFCRFLGRSTFQDDCKDIVGISQSSVSRAIIDVCNELILRGKDLIKMSTNDEMRESKLKFYEIGGIPNIIGVIDGSHIMIKSPSEDIQSLYICRKGGHSMNVQFITDSSYRIIDIVAKYAGST